MTAKQAYIKWYTKDILDVLIERMKHDRIDLTQMMIAMEPYCSAAYCNWHKDSVRKCGEWWSSLSMHERMQLTRVPKRLQELE